ncbi:MAG: hypothetical protein ABR977_00365 [Candidatus Dormibacteria bacterium]
MGREWWRSPWTILGVVVAVPVLAFTIPALMAPRRPAGVTRPTPPPATPGAVAEACGPGSIAADSAAPPPSPTLQAPLPTPRVGERIFYDSQQNDVLVLGGSDFTTGRPLSDAWTLDGAGWQSEASPDMAPGPVVQDPSSGRLTALDGSRSSGDGLQTWSWNGAAWTAAADLPLAGGWEVLGLEPLRTQLVLVAGNAARTATETWTWAAGGSWTLRHPVNELPAGASAPLLAADPTHDRIVALLDPHTPSGETTQAWAWGGSSWTFVTSTTRFGLDPYSESLAPDPQTGAVVLFLHPGGSAACTWALSGSTWEELSADSPDVDTSPDGTTLLADTGIGRVILVGGDWPDGNPLDVLWVLNGSRWTAEPASVLGTGPPA